MARNHVLWMGDLESYMDGNFIGEAFRKMGEQIVRVKLVMDKYDGHRAGYCFVDMPDEASARRAMLQINGKIIPNTRPPVKFNLSFANNPMAGCSEFNLFVNNLPEEVGDAELFQLFGHNYMSCRGAKVYKNVDGTSRGMGFVRFGNETDQQRALVEMNRRNVYGRPISLKLAPLRVKAPKYGHARGDYDPNNYYRQYQDYYNSTHWHMYDYHKRPEQASEADLLEAKKVSEKTSIVVDGLEMYDDGGMTMGDSNEVFMEQSEEVYAALRESCFFPHVHTAAFTFDDL